MNKNTNILHDGWNKSSGNISLKSVEHDINEFNRLITFIFSPCYYYYYIVDFFDMGTNQVSSSLLSTLGMNPEKITFYDIIDNIHPEDLPFVSQAEEMALNHIYSVIGKEKILYN